MFLYRNRRVFSTFRLKVEAPRNNSKSYRAESHTRNIIISGLVAYRAVIRTESHTRNIIIGCLVAYMAVIRTMTGKLLFVYQSLASLTDS